MDIRIEKTKTAIHNTFLELRSKKPLEKITIKELCEKAQINKSTFYSHYRDIYDLSDQTDDADQHKAELKQFTVCNHVTPLSCGGGRSPLRGGANRLPWCGNALRLFSEHFHYTTAKIFVNFLLLLANPACLCYNQTNKET